MRGGIGGELKNVLGLGYVKVAGYYTLTFSNILAILYDNMNS